MKVSSSKISSEMLGKTLRRRSLQGPGWVLGTWGGRIALGMTSLTAGTPEIAGHTGSTAVLEEAGLLQRIRHVPQHQGARHTSGSRRAKGCHSLFHQPGTRRS